MYNKFKIIKKIISIALALIMAASPVATFPMQVFAGTGSNGVIKAPTIKLNPALLKMQIGSKIDSSKYEVKDSVAFSVGGNGKVVSEDGTVSSAGIICVTDKETGVEKYVVSDAPSVINYVLEELNKELKSLESLGVDLTVVFENYPNLFGQGPGEDSSPDTADSFNIAAILAAIEALNALAEKANKGEKIDDVSAIEAISKASQAMETIVEEKVQQDPNNEEFRKQLADVQKQTSLFGEASSAVESAASNTSKSQSSNTPKKIEVSKITITGAPEVVHKGQTVQLTAEIEPSNATDQRVMWSSSNEDVAIVSSRGRVTAFGIGQVTITAEAGDKTATYTVTVDNPATSISLNKPQTTISKGQTENLTLTVDPTDTTDSIQVESNNPSVAEVSRSGNTITVNAKAVGTATITATAGDKTATCTVTVNNPAKSISLSKSQTTISKGKTENLTLTVDPNDTTDSIQVTSSNSSVAEVSRSGNNVTVTAKAAGQATITAKAGDKIATCTVTVNNPAKSISLSKTQTTISKGKTENLTLTVDPNDTTDSIQVESNNPSVAEVSRSGNTITVNAKAVGTATITATAGDKTATCTVTVNNPAKSISLSKSQTTISKGKTENLTLTVDPNDTTDSIQVTSSNSSVAEVSRSGNNVTITAKAAGTATITATAGDKTASVDINVLQPVTGFSISGAPANNKINVGKDFTLKAESFMPNNAHADYKKVEWSSNNTSVATVKKDTGEGTANEAGQATITATAKNGSETPEDWVTNDVIINVLQPVTEFSISGAPANNKINVGKDFTLKAESFMPNNAHADYKKVEWSSNNTSVATVKKDTGEGTANEAGQATITATAKNGSETPEDWVTNDVIINVLQPVTGIEIEGLPAGNTMDVGKTCTLTAKLSPDDVSDDYKKVTWSSDKPGVATVDQNGNVKAIAPGIATITAKAGGKTATCIVTVKASVESITISGAPDIMNKGDKAKLTAIVSPQGATSNPVKWSTSNDDVLKVDQNTGEIEAVVNNYMLASAKITATVDGISSSVLIKLVNSKEWLDSAKSVANGAYEYVDKKEVESNPLYKAWKDAEAAYNSSQTSSNANAMDNARGVYTSAVICAAHTFNVILKAVDDAYADTIGFFDNVLIASDAKVIATDGNGNFGVLDGGANLNEEIRLALCNAKESAQNCDIKNSKKHLETDFRIAYAGYKVAEAVFNKLGNTENVYYKEITGKLPILKGLIDTFFSTSTVIFKADSIEILNPNDTFIAGKTYQLDWNINPPLAKNKVPIWSSNKPNVLFVDQTGKLTAIESLGDIEITAKVDDIQSVRTFRVYETYQGGGGTSPFTGDFSFKSYDPVINLDKGETYQLKLKVPHDWCNISYKTSWQASGSVTVSDTGMLKVNSIGLGCVAGIVTSSDFYSRSVKMYVFGGFYDLWNNTLPNNLTAMGGLDGQLVDLKYFAIDLIDLRNVISNLNSFNAQLEIIVNHKITFPGDNGAGDEFNKVCDGLLLLRFNDSVKSVNALRIIKTAEIISRYIKGVSLLLSSENASYKERAKFFDDCAKSFEFLYNETFKLWFKTES